MKKQLYLVKLAIEQSGVELQGKQIRIRAGHNYNLVVHNDSPFPILLNLLWEGRPLWIDGKRISGIIISKHLAIHIPVVFNPGKHSFGSTVYSLNKDINKVV